MRRILVVVGLVSCGCCVAQPVNPCTVQSAAPCAVDTFIDADGSRKLYQRYTGGIHVEKLPSPAHP